MRRVIQDKVRLLPAGRDLLFESPCKLKRFLALAAEEPAGFAEASAEVRKQEEAGVSTITAQRALLFEPQKQEVNVLTSAMRAARG